MYLKKNIEIIKKINHRLVAAIINTPPAVGIQIVASKTGVPSIRIGNALLHSLYDPVREAEDWVRHYGDKIRRCSDIVVFGFGLGYHVSQLLKIHGSIPAHQRKIVIFESRLDILKVALEIVDLTDVLSEVEIVSDRDIPELDKGFVILKHMPSVNLNPEYFNNIHSKLNTYKTISKGLRIIVVGPIYGGSLPIARYCVDALKNLGHKVDFIDNSIYKEAFLGIDKLTSNKIHQDQLRAMLGECASESVIARSAEFKPDLIFALAQAPLNPASLIKLKENKIPTAFWFVEDFRLRDYWKDVAPFYDYFFTIQKKEFFDRLSNLGIRNFSYLPVAASKDIHKKLALTSEEEKKYGSDVSFVGAGYHNRRRFFEGLLDFDFKIWGNEWDLNSPIGRVIQRSGERVGTKEIVKIFNASKININLHSSVYHDGIDPYGDFVNPRTFEIAACRGFQLVDYRSELPDLFKIDKEIVCFKDLSDLRQKIIYYLDHPEKRDEIALHASERILKDHTYEIRMKEMLEFILNKGYELPSWNSKYEDVELLLETAGADTELGRYLFQFIDKGRICLDDIIEKIHSGNGELSDIEKKFLLMNEMKKVYLKD